MLEDAEDELTDGVGAGEVDSEADTEDGDKETDEGVAVPEQAVSNNANDAEMQKIRLLFIVKPP